MCQKIRTLCVLVVLALAVMARAQNPAPEVILSVPGKFEIINVPGQLVMKSFEIVGVKPEFRANLVRAFKPLLEKDGAGGRVLVAEQLVDGRKVIVLTVVATEKMQESIPQTISMINRGEMGFYAPFPGILEYEPRHRSVEFLALVMEKEITPIGLVYFDREVNRMTVEDDPNFIKYLEKVLERYDVPPAQLLVALDVIEIRSDAFLDFGVWWGAWQATLSGTVDIVASGAGQALDFQVTSWEAALKGLSPHALASFLRYLAGEGVVNIRSRTKLSAINAQKAESSWNVKVPYQTIRQEGDRAVVTDETVLEGVTLSIEPTIGTESSRLEIKATSTSVVGLSATGIPTVATSQVDTVINVTGEPMVLSGLKRTVTRTHTSGIPLLRSLPGLKHVFGSEKNMAEDWDVLVMMIPGG